MKCMTPDVYFYRLKSNFNSHPQKMEDDWKHGLHKSMGISLVLHIFSHFFFTSYIHQGPLYMSVTRVRYICGLVSKRAKLNLAPRVSIPFARHCKYRGSTPLFDNRHWIPKSTESLTVGGRLRRPNHGPLMTPCCRDTSGVNVDFF